MAKIMASKPKDEGSTPSRHANEVVVKIAGACHRLAFSPNELSVQSPLRAEVFPRAISVSGMSLLQKIRYFCNIPCFSSYKYLL